MEFIAIVYPGGTIFWNRKNTDSYTQFKVSTVPDSSFVIAISPHRRQITFKIFKG
jgi:hypothetical protein